MSQISPENPLPMAASTAIRPEQDAAATAEMCMATPQIEMFFDSASETFSYVVYDHVGGCAVIIDPVLDFDAAAGVLYNDHAERMVAFLNAQQLQLQYILETHAHADHISAGSYLKARCGGLLAIGAGIVEVQQHFSQVFAITPPLGNHRQPFDLLLHDGDCLQVGQLTIDILHTPGHTPADVSYLVNKTALFVGDTLFAPDVGTARCDFPSGDAATLYQSIQRILALPPQTQIYLCHDYPKAGRDYQYKTTVIAEKMQNIHVQHGISAEQFISMRRARDATLSMPKLMLPAIQLNINAGLLPYRDGDFLRLPLQQRFHHL